MSYTKYEPSLICGCWGIVQTRSVKKNKFKVTTPRSKVKCQKFAYHCICGLIWSSFLPIQIISIKNCEWPWPTFSTYDQHSKVKGHRSKLTYLCTPKGYKSLACLMGNCCYLRLLRYHLTKNFASKVNGSRSKVKGQICKITGLCRSAYHRDAIC